MIPWFLPREPCSLTQLFYWRKCSYRIAFHWLPEHLLISKATPFAGGCLQKYICLLERTESCWKEDSEEFFCTVHSHLASFNMLPTCLGALCGHLPSSGANWQHQASHGWGRKWSNWNLTNRTNSYVSIGGFQIPIKHPTFRGQAHDQKAAVKRSFYLVRSNFFYRSALMVRTQHSTY